MEHTKRLSLSAHPAPPPEAATADRFDNYIEAEPPPEIPPEGTLPPPPPAAATAALAATKIVRAAHQSTSTSAGRRGILRPKQVVDEDQERQRDSLRSFLSHPFTAQYRCTVMSTRGAPGGSTIAALLALTIADLAVQPTALLPVDPAGDTLTTRLTGQPPGPRQNWRELMTADQKHRLHHDDQPLPDTLIRHHLMPAIANPAVGILPSEPPEDTYDPSTFRFTQEALAGSYAPIVCDGGRDPVLLASQAALAVSEQLVLAAPLRGTDPAGTVLRWLAAATATGLPPIHQPIVVLTETAPTGLDPEPALAQLTSRGLATVHLPYDPHLAQDGPIDPDQVTATTLDIILYLAATVAQRAAARPNW